MSAKFTPPKELVDFLWDAAVAAASVVPGVSPIQVLGPGQTTAISTARNIMIRLIQNHVWCRMQPTQAWGSLDMAIHFGAGVPFPETPQRTPIPQTMIAHLIDRHPSAVSRIMQRYQTDAETRSAEQDLARGYANGTISTSVRFAGGPPGKPRTRDLTSPKSCSINRV
jgi:hypothetical protein